MNRRYLSALLSAAALTLSAATALAHGGAEHLMGTVKEASDKSLTLQTKDKKEVQVLLDGDTKYEKSGQPAAAADLKAGERVVVHAKKRAAGEDLHAAVIKFGKPAKGAAKAHEHHDASPAGVPANP